ncbi:protein STRICTOSIDINE SYNTHASE-LIKE 3-like [Salvia divinorum]|uniref:Protein STRICTOSIDINE SYNTHASE-LIKE 3-like n=1 Tax=Salvia divinorum TaxID=28513 RepID=A0ABD1GKA3_SALDI
MHICCYSPKSSAFAAVTPAGAFASFFILLAVYCAVDPFQHSAISEFPDFQSIRIEASPWSALPVETDRENLLQKSEIRILNQVQGPESMAFTRRATARTPASLMAGLYSGLGRSGTTLPTLRLIVLCNRKPSVLSYVKNEHICGRPLGLRFDKKSGDLERLLSSTKYRRWNFLQLIFSSEDSGRVLKIIRSLCSVSVRWRLIKYWLKGEKAGTWEPFAVLPGFPDNVRTNEKGEFWVAIHYRRSIYAHILGLYPKLRHAWLKLPISAKLHYLMQIGGRMHAAVVKYSEDGKLVQILDDRQGKVVRAVSEVEEREGKLWMGSVLMSSVAVYDVE